MDSSDERGIGEQGKAGSDDGKYKKGPEVEAQRWRRGVEERGDQDDQGPEVEAQRWRRGPEA